MVNGVVGVLPALIAQSSMGGAAVAQKPVKTVRFGGLNPCHRLLQGGQKGLNKRQLTGAGKIIGRKNHKQGRGIDRAVIPAKRHLTQGRHFTKTRLMKDLAGFRIGARIPHGGLMLS